MMNKLGVFGARSWRWGIAILSIIAIVGAISFVFTGTISIFAKGSSSHKGSAGGKVTVYIQTTDSCTQALSGATFTVVGPGVNTTTAPTNGGKPRQLPGHVSGVCPNPKGTCVNFTTGCTTAVLNVPASGTNVYKITVAKTATGQGTNISYAICQGGSACPHGPEVATVNVSSSGSVTATTHNFYPDGTQITWPSTGSFSGSQSNPVLFHEYGIGNGQGIISSCDGDHDADDRLTGSNKAPHCDSDNDGGNHP